MRKVFSFGVTLGAALLLTAGCDTKKKADTALDNANKLIEEYKRLGKNMNDTITEMKNSVKEAGKVSPASMAQVPQLPAKATGSVDVAAVRDGKEGKAQANIDGVGGNETVSAFVPDGAPGQTDGGLGGQTFANGGEASVFVSWAGDKESDDEGTCYLGWEKAGTAWMVAAPCGETTGAYVCQVTDSGASCDACNVEGQCTPCDMDKQDFDCTWPK